MGKTLYIVAYMQQNTRYSSYPYLKSRNVFKIEGDAGFCNKILNNTRIAAQKLFKLHNNLPLSRYYVQNIRVWRKEDYKYLACKDDLYLRKVNTLQSTGLLDILDNLNSE